MNADKMVIKSDGKPVFRGKTRDGRVVSGEAPALTAEEERRLAEKLEARRRTRRKSA